MIACISSCFRKKATLPDARVTYWEDTPIYGHFFGISFVLGAEGYQ